MSEKGIGVVGTMNQTRMANINLPNKKEVKKWKRGNHQSVYLKENNVVTVWKDYGPVSMASNFADVDPLGACKRYSSVPVFLLA